MKAGRVIRIDFAMVLVKSKGGGGDMAIVVLKRFQVNIEEVACKLSL